MVPIQGFKKNIEIWYDYNNNRARICTYVNVVISRLRKNQLLADLSLMTWPDCPVPAVLSRLSYHGCPITAVLLGYPVAAALLRLPYCGCPNLAACPGCPIPAVLFQLSCSGYLSRLFCPKCLIPAVLLYSAVLLILSGPGDPWPTMRNK